MTRRPCSTRTRGWNCTPTAARALWATYPHSDSYTGTLIALLQRKHVPTTVNPQSGKASLRATVQFLLPILILVTLFAFFMTLLQDQGAAFARSPNGPGAGRRPARAGRRLPTWPAPPRR